jgi:hypothetical protein
VVFDLPMRIGAKRESGEGQQADAGAAPATVNGEPLSTWVTDASGIGKARQRR